MRGALPRVALVCALAAMAAACSTAPVPEIPTVSLPSGNGVYKIGQPYEEDGSWYYPREQPEYDETGIASWYGPNFHHKRTANGELFDADGLTAAHPTLPMPVNVRVTNLENGKSLVLRVNDRGPFSHNRIIDVSERAAQLLGFHEKGTAEVRVTYLARADLPGVAPVEAPAAVATAVTAAPSEPVRMAALDPVAAAPATQAGPDESDEPPQADPTESSPAVVHRESSDTVAALPPPAAGHIWVQAGTFAVQDNADRLKDRLSAIGNVTISSIDSQGRILYRVRIGPFDDVGAADAALARLDALGTSGARVVADQ